MNQSEIEEIAKEFFCNSCESGCQLDHYVHCVDATKIFLDKLSQLQSRIAELKARVNELETFIR